MLCYNVATENVALVARTTLVVMLHLLQTHYCCVMVPPQAETVNGFASNNMFAALLFSTALLYVLRRNNNAHNVGSSPTLDTLEPNLILTQRSNRSNHYTTDHCCLRDTTKLTVSFTNLILAAHRKVCTGNKQKQYVPPR